MSTHLAQRRVAAGFSLIELLVSMVIALVVTLAISSVMIRSESSKRSTTSVDEVSQTATYISYVLDRVIRSAGSGFAQRWPEAVGCLIDASNAGGAVLPIPAVLPVPFANVPLRVRLAPVLIGKGMADSGGQVRGDVITVMAGTAGAGDMPQQVIPGSVGAGTLRVANGLGYRDMDLVLLADNVSVPGGCMVQQIVSNPAGATPPSPVAGDVLPFTGGVYSRSIGNVVNLANFGASTVAIQLGSAPGNPPQMLLYGVGDNSTLSSYDLMRVTSTAATPVADGVVEMRALYGLDTNKDGVIDAWVDPVAGSGFSQAELTDGAPDAVTRYTRLRQIVAVRVGLILRTSLMEREQIKTGSTTLTLFGDLGPGLQQTRVLAGDELSYRFRTVEFTVPLRNTIYAP